MKKILSMAVLGFGISLMAFSAAQASETGVDCRNISGLPSGLFVTIRQNMGKTVAELTNRDDIGPCVDLGEIAVTRKPVPAHVMGAPLTYIGKDFELEITVDGLEPNGSHYAHVYADIDGSVFNEPMYCTLTSAQ